MKVLKNPPCNVLRRSFAGALVCSLVVIAGPVDAANPTTFDLDGDGINETVASSTRVAAGDLQNDFYDTISVNNPHAFTSLTFDWQLPDAYRFKGGVPVGAAKWSSTNHYDSYIIPFEFSYSLDLTPAGCPAGIGCPATTRTADAWTPVNGYKALKALRDLFSVVEVEGDVRADDDILVKVWSRGTAEGSLTRYEYFAQNLSDTSVDLSWTAYDPTRSNPLAQIDGLVLPGATKMLTSFTRLADPAEAAGQVRATIGGQETWFIAPMIVAVPEPSSAGLLAVGAVLLAWRLRRQMRPGATRA